MKTYTIQTTETRPLLEIRHCDNDLSPREDTNLGYFITCDSNYYSPDKHEELERIVKETGELAISQEEHTKMIKEEFKEEKIIAIYPISKYEHSRVSYSLGSSFGFDNSNNGFYIITKETQKEAGVKKKDFKKAINEELKVYNKYANGEVYEFVLYDKNGEHEDSSSGFYDIEDIRDHLPKSWKKEDLNKYMNYD